MAQLVPVPRRTSSRVRNSETLVAPNPMCQPTETLDTILPHNAPRNLLDVEFVRVLPPLWHRDHAALRVPRDPLQGVRDYRVESPS